MTGQVKQIWTKDEQRAWRRPERITVSEWAEMYRYLNPFTSAEPGRWKTSRTPYLHGVMDAFTDPGVEEITVMAASQVGKTEALYNMLGYVIDQDPGPALMVLPRETDARSVSQNRVLPMIKGSPRLARYIPQSTDDIKRIEYRFERMVLYFAGSNSPADLASRPIRYLFLDEIDKYPRFSGREADPVKLASERQKTFWNKKTIKVSTPTTRDGYIYREYEKSDRCRYFVPCPHCGEYQVLVFGQIKWPEEKRDGRVKGEKFAWYECVHCGEIIKDYEKPGMLEGGRWVPEGCDIDKSGTVSGDITVSRHRGFSINSLYSPWLTWSDIASEFLRSKDYIELLMNFANSWLAEVWEEKIEEATVDRVKALACEYEQGFVPDGAVVLTAGVDVQKDHFYYVVRGWGYEEQSWLVRCGTFEYWDDLVEILFKTDYVKRSTGEALPVYMTSIDSGYRTDEVYHFVRRWSDRAKAIKGQDELTDGRFYRASKIDINSRTGSVIKNGLVLWKLNTSWYKDRINRLVSSTDPVKWHLFSNPPDDYLRQFTSEHKVLLRNRSTGRAKEAWQPKRLSTPNHYLDAEVYAVAAADIIRALRLRRDERTVHHGKDRQRAHSRTDWIRRREGSWM